MIPSRRFLPVATLLLASCAVAPPPLVPPLAGEVARLEAEVERRPTDRVALARLAHAHREAGRLEQAALLLERAVEGETDYPGAVLLLGLTYEELERFADARRLYLRYAAQTRYRDLRAQALGRAELLRRAELQQAVRAAVERERDLAAAAPPPLSVAVFPFAYTELPEPLRPLSRALAEMITTDLAQVERLRVMERLQVQLLLDEVRLGAQGRVDEASAARAGRILGAERIVQGVMEGSEERLFLDVVLARSVAAADEALPPTISEQEAARRLFDAQKRIVLRIVESMGVAPTPAERERLMLRPTENVQALLAFGRGLEARDAGDHARAAEHFSSAVRIDPGFAQALSAAAAANGAAAAARTAAPELARAGGSERGRDGDPSSQEALIPTVTERDAASELFGLEGIGPRQGRLRVVVRRP